MSATRQIALSIVLVLMLAAGWLGYQRGWFGSHDQQAATTAASGGGGAAGGQQGNRNGGAGGAPAAPVITAAVGTDNTGLDVTAIGTVAAAQEVRSGRLVNLNLPLGEPHSTSPIEQMYPGRCRLHPSHRMLRVR